MKKIKSADLLEQLESDVRKIIVSIHQLQKEDPAMLLQQPGAQNWSAVQAIEHLNSYGRYYLPAINKALQQATVAADGYQAGWLGDYFTRLMQPQNGTISKKMKAPANHRPSQDLDAKPVLDEFLQQQQTLLQLLEKARQRNISRSRVPISIMKMVKLKVGDVFRFVIAHEQRHVLQANKAVQNQQQQAGILV